MDSTAMLGIVAESALIPNALQTGAQSVPNGVAARHFCA